MANKHGICACMLGYLRTSLGFMIFIGNPIGPPQETPNKVIVGSTQRGYKGDKALPRTTTLHRWSVVISEASMLLNHTKVRVIDTNARACLPHFKRR